MNKDSSSLVGIFFFKRKMQACEIVVYISSLSLNETPILKTYGTDVTQLEDIPNPYAVASFHEIWHGMPLVNIVTSHFFILYNWWKIMLAETLDYLVCIVVVRKLSSAFRLTVITIETLWVLIWSFACNWVMDAHTNCAWHIVCKSSIEQFKIWMLLLGTASILQQLL